jgi:hypothetical protein
MSVKRKVTVPVGRSVISSGAPPSNLLPKLSVARSYTPRLERTGTTRTPTLPREGSHSSFRAHKIGQLHHDSLARLRWLNSSEPNGQHHSKARLTCFGCNSNLSAVFVDDDIVGDVQPQSCACAGILRGKEGVEDTRLGH